MYLSIVHYSLLTVHCLCSLPGFLFLLKYFSLKKSTFLLIPVVIVSCAMYVSCATQEQTADVKSVAPVDTIAPAKPGPFSGTLNFYYQLKNAFVATDGTAADLTASQLRISIDSLDAKKLLLDTTLNTTITGYKKTMITAVDALIKERNMLQKRKQFQVISDALYSLMQAAPYKGATVYQLHCPMAFETGANWLNDVPVVNNPYYGSKMLTCGSVVDSLGR